jgi:hypothetical protein
MIEDLIYYLPVGISSLILLIVLVFWNKTRKIKDDMTTDVNVKELEWVNFGSALSPDRQLSPVDKQTLPIKAINKLNDRISEFDKTLSLNVETLNKDIARNYNSNETLDKKTKALNDRLNTVDKSIEVIESDINQLKEPNEIDLSPITNDMDSLKQQMLLQQQNYDTFNTETTDKFNKIIPILNSLVQKKQSADSVDKQMENMRKGWKYG